MFPATAGRVAAFGMGTNIEVYLSNAHFGLAPPIDIEKRLCLVIDVIRATSTIATALGRGADRVVISPSTEQAFKAKLSRPDSVLCGEAEVSVVQFALSLPLAPSLSQIWEREGARGKERHLD